MSVRERGGGRSGRTYAKCFVLAHGGGGVGDGNTKVVQDGRNVHHGLSLREENGDSNAACHNTVIENEEGGVREALLLFSFSVGLCHDALLDDPVEEEKD